MGIPEAAAGRMSGRERGAAAPGSPAGDVVDRVRPVAERIARDYGLDLFDLQFRREAGGWVLRVFIDRPEGTGPDASRPGQPADSIGIEECERISRELGTVLDVEDVCAHAYTLEVSSPGLDRPLRHEADYRRFAGRLAKIVLAEAVDGQTFFAGRLQGCAGDEVLLTDQQGLARRLPLRLITRARLEVEF